MAEIRYNIRDRTTQDIGAEARKYLQAMAAGAPASVVVINLQAGAGAGHKSHAETNKNQIDVVGYHDLEMKSPWTKAERAVSAAAARAVGADRFGLYTGPTLHVGKSGGLVSRFGRMVPLNAGVWDDSTHFVKRFRNPSDQAFLTSYETGQPPKVSIAAAGPPQRGQPPATDDIATRDFTVPQGTQASLKGVTPEAQQVYQLLVTGDFGHGIAPVPPAVAAAAVGNMMQESYTDLRPDAQGAGGERGIGQWMPDRYANMEAWAAGHNLDPMDRATQALFYSHELQNSPAWSAISAAKSVPEATQLIASKFERAGNPMMDRRIGYANAVAQVPAARLPEFGTPVVAGYTNIGGSEPVQMADAVPASTPVSAATPEPSQEAWNKLVSDAVFGGNKTGDKPAEQYVRSIASTPPGQWSPGAARDLPQIDWSGGVQRNPNVGGSIDRIPASAEPLTMYGGGGHRNDYVDPRGEITASPAEKPSTYTPTWTYKSDPLTPTKDPLQAVNEGQTGGLIKAAQQNMATVGPTVGAEFKEAQPISPTDYAFGRPDTVDIGPDLSIPAAAPMLAKDEPVKAPSMAVQGPPQTFDMSPTREPTRLNKLFGMPGMQSYSGVSPIAQSVIDAAHEAGYGVSPGTPAGYKAPNFSSGSGGAVFAYKPNVDANGNPTGTGTYINSYGQTMTY